MRPASARSEYRYEYQYSCILDNSPEKIRYVFYSFTVVHTSLDGNLHNRSHMSESKENIQCPQNRHKRRSASYNRGCLHDDGTSRPHAYYLTNFDVLRCVELVTWRLDYLTISYNYTRKIRKIFIYLINIYQFKYSLVINE